MTVTCRACTHCAPDWMCSCDTGDDLPLRAMKAVVRAAERECGLAIAAGARSAETNEDLAQSEGRQSGGKASPKVQP
jgi:hypothetical protein